MVTRLIVIAIFPLSLALVILFGAFGPHLSPPTAFAQLPPCATQAPYCAVPSTITLSRLGW